MYDGFFGMLFQWWLYVVANAREREMTMLNGFVLFFSHKK